MRACVVCGASLTGRRSDARVCGSRCYTRHRDKPQRVYQQHGESRGYRRSAEFRIWAQMVRRCHSPNAARYADYGGRGIEVCSRWRESVLHFIEDMGRRPGPGYTLERIDNDGCYEPGNCRWATRTEQARNKRSNRQLTFRGQTQPISAWAEETGIDNAAIRRRLEIGWSISDALTQPVRAPRRGRPAGEWGNGGPEACVGCGRSDVRRLARNRCRSCYRAMQRVEVEA